MLKRDLYANRLKIDLTVAERIDKVEEIQKSNTEDVDEGNRTVGDVTCDIGGER